MRFSTKEDLEIPIEQTFEMLSDFENYERAAIKNGADVVRVDQATAKGVGMSWRATAPVRGRMRSFAVTLTEYEKPSVMRFDAESGGMIINFVIDLVPLSRNRTRVRMELDIRPRTLSARLLMQSVRLARNTLNRRYKRRIANFGEDLEDRYAAALRRGSSGV
ncbi:SRPBCC family protein [Litoreibacter roseus]|uniref:Polyketide cyclase / dehydrase and lipid transport n=1 Tax=Litoreibacter roseus TaxID=2601869 RepID=A0A6N6JFG0_9RHOB|nr:SRPBCC family protein [Litoreibacter roseus]GFE64874.1 hypothetical protein KIN_19480 [Litoreibacter roseus]